MKKIMIIVLNILCANEFSQASNPEPTQTSILKFLTPDPPALHRLFLFFVVTKRNSFRLNSWRGKRLDISKLPWKNITTRRADLLKKNEELIQIKLPDDLRNMEGVLDITHDKILWTCFSNKSLNNIFIPNLITVIDDVVFNTLKYENIPMVCAIAIPRGINITNLDDEIARLDISPEDKEKINAIICEEPSAYKKIPSWCKIIIGWLPTLIHIQSLGDLFRAKIKKWKSFSDECFGMLIIRDSKVVPK
ncbi:MAG: hypothetical protein K6C34_04525 [Alphaproteobacteria bacterium]|nr:hypothetical protein [Alphaproteobacteria bacterium]